MKIKRNKGFSLIEVMIALVIIAVGVLGISKLQGTLLKSGSNANQRAIAISIAQKKIDDLKSFAELRSATAWSESASGASSMNAVSLAYEHIQTSEGGAPVGSSDLLAAAITVGNYNYTLDWAVTDYWYTASLSAASEVDPALPLATSLSDMKLVTVTVAWVDEAGVATDISLETILNAYDPALTALADNSGGGGSRMPGVSYTPELAPDVIDVDVDTGDGQFRQTSKPLPDAVATGGDSNTLVSFEVITYHADGDAFIADTKEEFVTVDCTCQFVSNGLAYPPAHVVWNDSDKSRYDYVGEQVEKITATEVDNANAVDEICTTCCRDHHDDTNSVVKYVAGTTSGDHNHYQSNGTTLAIQADGDEYVESCRFKRVNGILRVFQDWKLYDITTMDRAALGGGESLQIEYSTYVGHYVLDHVNGTNVATKPDTSTNISALVGGSHQLESRGIYIDNVYELDGSISSSYNGYIAANSPVNVDRLEKIPFSEVNLSRLAHWVSTDITKAIVTDEPVATIVDPVNDYYGTYSRGYMTAISPPGTTIQSKISGNNNGLTQIVNATNPAVSDLSDLVLINVAAGGSPITISGTYSVSYPVGITQAPPTIELTGETGVTCSLPGGNTYTCSVTAPWTGTITLSVKAGSGNNKCGGNPDPDFVVYNGDNLSNDTTYNFPVLECD